MRAQEIIRAKREGRALDGAQIDAFVRGLSTHGWSEGQVAALAMAICHNGMTQAEVVALTRAMTASGAVLDWSRERNGRPVLDKHSTGGVGDKVSLLLAPIVAACGALVPMVSGRGLGHTGGTLDKLSALPGYNVTPSRRTLVRTLRDAGCAIVGASARIAPADRRLYAIRDATGTVESLPLITASILSKKLAAGLHGLVMDVKVGNGAFCANVDEARALATLLVAVARGAGLPTTALVTDMDQVLGSSAGNALEVREAIDVLCGRAREPRLVDLTLELSARLLQLGGLHADLAPARAQAQQALDSGAAAAAFARMVAALGGPRDVLDDAALPAAPCLREVVCAHDGVLIAMDTRAIGLAVIALGGGRDVAGADIDPRVGFDRIVAVGAAVRRGQPLARVHAASDADAARGAALFAAALHIGDAPVRQAPLVHEVIATA
ncbi:MAG TPA: thymidine phosphorylase [Burkholderiaceae bacterium]